MASMSFPGVGEGAGEGDCLAEFASWPEVVISPSDFLKQSGHLKKNDSEF